MQYFPEKMLTSFPLMRLVTDCGPMHSHNFWEIAVFLRGKAYNNNLDKEKISCPPNTCLILRPEIDYHYVEHDSAPDFAHIDIYVTKEKMQNVCSMIKTDDGTPFIDILMKSEQNPQFSLSTQTVALIENALFEENFYPQTAAVNNIHSSIIFLILSEYFSQLANPKNKQIELIYQVFRLLKDPNNFTKRLDEIIKQIPFSRTYINQEFKKATNSTLVEYFSLQKILHASVLLLNTNDTILTIANTVGFSTPKNFIAQFKKVFKCNPSDYKKTHPSWESRETRL